MRKKAPREIFDATLNVTHLGRSGDGVAVLDDKNIFVPYTLPGETVEATITRHPKFPATAKVKSVTTPAANRQVAPCKHFGTCGGCSLQHMNEASYRAFKVGLLKHELERAGVDTSVLREMAISPPGSRRRVVYSARRFRDGTLSAGFNERGANWMVNVTECHVVKPEIINILQPLRDVLGKLLEPGDKTDIAVTWFPEGLDIVLLGLPRLDWQGKEVLAQFAAEHKLTRLSIRARRVKDRDPVYQSATPSCQFGSSLKVYPPAGAFLQATLEGEAAMAKAALDAIKTYAPNATRFADLFSGSGTFSGVLADIGKQVLSVEFEGESLESLRAAKHPRIMPRAGDLMSEPLMPTELNTFDVVLFDPPRAGAKTQSEQLAQSKVPLVIGISCNPETFARDAKILIDGGYKLRDLIPVDQFLWAAHLEVVGVFTRD